MVYTTGGKISWGRAAKHDGTYAEHCVARLSRCGVPTNALVGVPSRQADLERTFQSALALREYFRKEGLAPKVFECSNRRTARPAYTLTI